MSQLPMTILELRDAIAKAIADARGHGMREKCEKEAEAVLKVVVPQLVLTAEEAREEYPECSGDPSCCPENEGFGCCKRNGPRISCAACGKPIDSIASPVCAECSPLLEEIRK